MAAKDQGAGLAKAIRMAGRASLGVQPNATRAAAGQFCAPGSVRTSSLTALARPAIRIATKAAHAQLRGASEVRPRMRLLCDRIELACGRRVGKGKAPPPKVGAFPLRLGAPAHPHR